MSASIRMRFYDGEYLGSDIPPFVRTFIHGSEGVVIHPCYYGHPSRKTDGKTVMFLRIHETDGHWNVGEPDCALRLDVMGCMMAMQAAYDWCVRKARLQRDGLYFMFNPGTPCCDKRPVCKTKPDAWWVPEFKGVPLVTFGERK